MAMDRSKSIALDLSWARSCVISLKMPTLEGERTAQQGIGADDRPQAGDRGSMPKTLGRHRTIAREDGHMPQHEKTLAAALLTVVVALLLVGLVSGTVLRHVVQVLPVLVASLVVMLRPAWSRFAAMPVLAFWLFIMVLIWLYLLGLANVVNGQFAPAEVGLTVVIGIGCVVGLRASVRQPTRSQWWASVVVFLLSGAFQVGAMWLSLQPAFASR